MALSRLIALKPLQAFERLLTPGGGPSVSAFILITTAMSLNGGFLLLCHAAYAGKEVSVSLGIVVAGLNLLVGYAYGRSKTTQERVAAQSGEGQVSGPLEPKPELPPSDPAS